MNQPAPDPAPPPVTAVQKIDVLFEEYKALYGLAQFRLTSLERRATLAWAALGAFLTGFGAMAPDAQRAFLIGVPLAIFWLLRTTINHARSFEDALRRLDEIECTVNRLAGDDLLVFQSRHPSRGGANAAKAVPASPSSPANTLVPAGRSSSGTLSSNPSIANALLASMAAFLSPVRLSPPGRDGCPGS